MFLTLVQQAVLERLDTSHFLLCCQRLSDNAMDEEAVMDSKEVLREWSDKAWSEDNFGLQQNLDDITGHIKGFEHNLVCSVRILISSEVHLLSSLYIKEVASFLKYDQTDGETLACFQPVEARWRYPAFFNLTAGSL